MDDKEFAGRTALVTGGSRGIGRAICERLATTGARIAVNYAVNADAAKETRDRVAAAGGEARMYQADMSDRDQTGAMFDGIERDFGPVDLLVTNAGIARSADAVSMAWETWHEVMTVNLDGTFHPVWRAKDGMMARGYGRIVCISSVLGLKINTINPVRQIAYGTSKAAIIGFVRNCAGGFGPDVRVNGVAPGFIDTDMTDDVSDEARQRLIAATPVRRVGKPSEIAEVVAFLLSDKSSYITGQTSVASGGMVTSP